MKTFVERLFDEEYPVYINSRIRLAITEQVEVPVIEGQFDAMTTAGDVVTVQNASEEYILRRMLGGAPETGDIESDREAAGFVSAHTLKVHEIVEVWDLTGELRFVNMRDVLHVYKVANGYLAELKQRKRFSPNWNQVPEDDIRKLEEISDGLERYAYMIENDGELSAPLAALFGGSIISSLYVPAEDQPPGFLITTNNNVEDDFNYLPSTLFSSGGR